MDALTNRLERLGLDNGSYIDAVIQYATDNMIDIEDVYMVLEPPLQEKIKQEFINKNFVKGEHNETSLEDFFK